jgi:hypothetical protein
MNSIDIMIDLETTGIHPGCCILSLGASSFDQQHTFYQKISHDDSLRAGFFDDPFTIAWWNKQSLTARTEAFSGTTSIANVLGDFSTFLWRLPADKKKVFVWGNGADFDLPILQAAYLKLGMKVPWEPFNGRCYRTLKNLYKDVKMEPFTGVKHSALADAMNQAAHAHKILSKHFNEG